MALQLGFYACLAVAGWLTISSLIGKNADPRTRSFAAFGLMVGCWVAGELLIMTAETPSERAWARLVLFVGPCGLPPVWLWTAASSARPGWFERRPESIALVFALPLFLYSSLIWDSSDRFLRLDGMAPAHGPWFDVFITHQYALILAGAALFMRTAIRLGRSSSWLMPMLVTGVALPLTANFAYYVGWLSTDWTAVALAPSAMLIWFSIVDSGLISKLPIDRHDVIQQLDVGVIVANPDGRIVSANPAAEKFAGCKDLSGRTLAEAVAAAEEKADLFIESRGIELHGRFGVVGRALLMTDRTESEAARRQVALGGRLEALGSLTAGIAHEVNNPLAFIQANLSALEETAKSLNSDVGMNLLEPPLREAVRDMSALVEETQEGVERIRLLVQRLKSFSRAPDLDATLIEVDVARTARQAAAVARIGQVGNPIMIETDSPNGSILTVESALFQILVNLLINAIQASGDEPAITLSIENVRGGMAIRVRDRGPGIPDSLLPRIFDPFFTTKASGTGLGLALSYDLALALGGELDAANAEGGGAVFELWLPRTPPASSQLADGMNDEESEASLSVA